MKRIALAILLAVVLAGLVTAAPVEVGGALGFEVAKWVFKRAVLRH